MSQEKEQYNYEELKAWKKVSRIMAEDSGETDQNPPKQPLKRATKEEADEILRSIHF